nr:DUF4145 domain-containing protein [Pandoraea sp. LA3]
MVLRCASCNDKIIVTGIHGTEEWETPFGEDFVELLYPKFFLPAVPIINIPDACPSSIRYALYQAFSAYWSSPKNSANSIRIALEHLMDEQQIPPNNLHQRIEAFGKIRPDIHDFLEAAKWVGNDGSHKGEVEHSLVLDVLEMVEHALEVLYPKDVSALRKKAQAIRESKKKKVSI